MNLLDLLMNRGFDSRMMNTPGINPNAPDPRLQMPSIGGMGQMGPLPNPALGAKAEPMGTLLSPILSKLGPIGRGADSLLGSVGGAARNAASSGALAALAPRTTKGIMQGDENRRADDLAAMRKKLMEAQIGRLNSPDPTNTNVQSTFQGQNGNMHIVTRNGEVKDTGVAFNENLRTITRPDGSVVLVDDTRGGRSEPVEVVTPEEAVAGAADRKSAERRASDQAAIDVKAINELPSQIAKDDEFVSTALGFIDDLREGTLETGPILGKFPAITTKAQLFEAFSGENVLSLISEATFGALSEGEREFLVGVTMGRNKTEEANIEILEKKVRMMRGAQQRAREKIEAAGGTAPASSARPTGRTATGPSGERMRELSDGSWVPFDG